MERNEFRNSILECDLSALKTEDNSSLIKSEFNRRIRIKDCDIPNAICMQPMESSGSLPDGSPDQITQKKYERFAKSGAGLIWYEAIAVSDEARSTKKHLLINDSTVPAFKAHLNTVKSISQEAIGGESALLIAQLTHNGRLSKNNKKVIACHNEFFDFQAKIPNDYPVLTDDELEKIEDSFVEAALSAEKAGFHGVDIKACHCYLISELLSCYEREGRYGGDFEGRTRFLFNVIDRIREKAGEQFIITTRICVTDGFPGSWGWTGKGYSDVDLEETKRLIDLLQSKGIDLINLSMGKRAYTKDLESNEIIVSEEKPIDWFWRILHYTKQLKLHNKDVTIVGTGYSVINELAPLVAAICMNKGYVDIAGFGRQSLAYPGFVQDILFKGSLEKRSCCKVCDKCLLLLRAGLDVGCTQYDPYYADLFNSL